MRFRTMSFAKTQMIATFRPMRGVGYVASAGLGIGQVKSIELSPVLRADVPIKSARGVWHEQRKILERCMPRMGAKILKR